MKVCFWAEIKVFRASTLSLKFKGNIPSVLINNSPSTSQKIRLGKKSINVSLSFTVGRGLQYEKTKCELY